MDVPRLAGDAGLDSSADVLEMSSHWVRSSYHRSPDWSFRGYFQVVPNARPLRKTERDEANEDLVRALNATVDRLFSWPVPSDLMRAEAHQQRLTRCRNDLWRIAGEITVGTAATADLLIRLGAVLGAFEQAAAEQAQALPCELRAPAKNSRLTILHIDHPPHMTVLQQKLMMQAYEARTVIDQLTSQALRKQADTPAGLRNSETLVSEHRSYLEQLVTIINDGLSSPEAADYAFMRLGAFKAEVLNREAGRAKNTYIKELAVFMLVICVMAAAVWLWAWRLDRGSFAMSFGQMIMPVSHYAPLVCGASIGTFLSFTIRRSSMAFEDLSRLEPDHLHPLVRLVFVTMLTCLLGIVMELSGVGISFGSTDLSPMTDGRVGLLLGAFCGLSERSLSRAIAMTAENVTAHVLPSRSDAAQLPPDRPARDGPASERAASERAASERFASERAVAGAPGPGTVSGSPAAAASDNAAGKQAEAPGAG